MKTSNTYSMDLCLNGKAAAAGFMAKILAKILDKKGKNDLSGDGSCVAKCSNTVHVECTSSVEYSAEEAELAAKIQQESFNNLVANTKNVVSASKEICEYLRTEGTKFAKWGNGLAEELN